MPILFNIPASLVLELSFDVDQAAQKRHFIFPVDISSGNRLEERDSDSEKHSFSFSL